MRPKVAISVLVVSILAAIAVLLIPKPGANPATAGAPQAEAQAADASGTNPSVAPAHARPDALAANNQPAADEAASSAEDDDDDASPMASPEAKHRAYVHDRVIELGDLGGDDDPASLDNILSDLGNRDPEIRQAAVAAAVQFGSRDAIPKLQDALLQADDPHEKAAIADAIEFLQAPSLSDLLAQQRAAAAGAGH